ncbi:MAG TPA: ATP-binding protein [Polyangiaceae bacterium]|nr:ATP-binding protein [Polyangiaceae bacterium]
MTGSAARRIHALIVDDNEELAENVADILAGIEGMELETHLAASAHEAIRQVERLGDELDLSLVDLRLPDGNGLGLLSQLRERSSFAEFLVITGDLSIESAVAAVDARVFAYVLKPFRPLELQSTARHAITQVELKRRARRLQRELELSEHRHREVVEAIPAFVLALDREHQIVLWNQRLEAVTGFSRAEMIGQSGADLIREGGDRKLDLKGGGHRLVRWQCTEVANTTYALGIDVTEEREMLRRTLQAERLASAGTLAAGLAHEVRNPLNSATLQLQVLKRRIERGNVEKDKLLPVISVVDGEIQRLTHLVSDFLAFARPHKLEIESTDLNDFLNEVLDLVTPECKLANVQVCKDFAQGIGRLELEPNRIRQVLLNLIRNAIEAMPDGGLLTLHTSEADSAGFVHIEVQDPGKGFAEDAPVFDAFYTTKPGGTGLGLAIAHRIVTEHGGVLKAEPRSPGACFSVLLPQHSKT